MPEIGCPLAEAARLRPDAPALITDQATFTYRDFDHLTAPHATGTAPGRLVLELPPSPAVDVIVRIWRAFRMGRTVALTDSRLPESMRSESRADGEVIAAAQYRDEDELRNELKRRETHTLAVIDYARPLAKAGSEILTSGSTARPKRCLLSFANHYYNALGSIANLPLGPGDRWLLSLPLCHVGGLAILFRAAIAGAAVVVGNSAMSAAEAIREYGVTHCSMVPTQLRRYLADVQGPHRLKAILLGGAAVAPSLVDAAVDRGLPIFTSYGLTEMASQVATTPPGAPRAELRSSGRLLPYRELRIDASGEILVRGRTLCRGYLDGSELRPTTDAAGWHHTGDIGHLDPDGCLHVSGRRDNMFTSGGENVHPEMIERVLLEYPGITEVAVVAVDDEAFGQRPFAFVSLAGNDAAESAPLVRLLREYIDATNGAADTPVQIREDLKDRLPRYAVPVGFALIPDHARRGLKTDRPSLGRFAAELRRARR